jgi:broad specificity phosphatase PhoE
MPDILLVRHGVPACDYRSRVRGRDFARWVDTYDAAPIDRAILPPQDLVARAEAAGLILTSTFRRAIESAQILAPNMPASRDALFDEARVPALINVNFALHPLHWDALISVAWLLGRSHGVESTRVAARRAARAAHRLTQLAADHDSVLLVGHGMMNTFIARALKHAAWRGTGSPRKWWGCLALRR